MQRVETGFGPTRVTLRDSLVERATEFGVFSAGVELAIERSVVRETLQELDHYGRGISVRDQPMTGERATLSVVGSVVELNHRAGILAFASDAIIEATVVRDTLAGVDGPGAPGVWAMPDETGQRSTVEVRSSFVTRNSEAGILDIGSDAVVQATTVRGNLPSATNPNFGRGIEAQLDPTTGAPAVLIVVQSTIDDNRSAGVTLWGADATFDGTLVRGTTGNVDRTIAGIGADVEEITQTPVRITVRGSRIEGNRDVGILLRSCEARIEGTAFVDTVLGPAGLGRSVHVNGTDPVGTRASLELSASRISGSPEFGVFALGSDVTVSGTAIAPSAAVPLRGGVLVGWDADRNVRGAAEIRDSTVDQAHFCGIYVLDADVHIDHTVVRGSVPHAVKATHVPGYPFRMARVDWACHRMCLGRRVRAAFAKLIASVLFLSASHGQTDSRAERLFDEGLEALKRGDYRAACPALAESYELEPLVGALFTLAECEARSGRVLSATRHFRRFVDEVEKLPEGERERQRERTTYAAQSIERLGAQVPTLTIVVSEPMPGGTSVMRNGVAVPAEQLNKPMRLDPGEHRIVVRSADGAETSTLVMLEPSTAEKIAVRLPKTLEAKTVAPRRQPQDGASSMSPLRIGGIVALAFGGSALAVGLAAGGVLLSRKDTIQNNCTAGVCNDEGFEAAEDVPLYNVMATAGVVIGAAALVSGVIMLGVSAMGDEDEPAVRADATRLEVRW